MKRFYINEIQFNKVLASLITEAAETLKSIYLKWYADIPSDEFMKVVKADPTYREEKGDKMGKYGKWLLGLYRRKMLKLEDLYKATEYLTYFVKYYNKIPQKDIMKYPNLPSLYDAVSTFINAEMNGNEMATSKSDEVRRIKSDVKKVYEDENWLILIPLTKEASIYYGKNTQWCTAAEHSNNMFDYYNSKGPLYINIDKRNGYKYQFNFETSSFMDARDYEIDDPIAETIDMDDNVVMKVYRDRFETLTKNSSITSLGDNLYFNPTKCVVYRLYDGGMFHQEIGYARKEIARVTSMEHCVKLSNNIWWFQAPHEAYGYFYNVNTDELTLDKNIMYPTTYTNPKTKTTFIIATRINSNYGTRSFIGKMIDNEIKVITNLNSSSYDTLPLFLENNGENYIQDTLNRYILTFSSEYDAEEDGDIVSIYDIDRMRRVCDSVVLCDCKYGSDNKYYAVFRDGITNEEVYWKAEEDYDDYDEDTQYFNEIVEDFIENKARKYYICIDDGEMYNYLP